MKVIYEEPLTCKGKLVVLENRWYFSFEEQGPDNRYKKRPFQVLDKEFNEFCERLKKNFIYYEEQKQKGCSSIIKGEGGKWIRFGIREGVCLFYQSYPIKSRKKLEETLLELQRAKEKAEQLLNKEKKETLL